MTKTRLAALCTAVLVLGIFLGGVPVWLIAKRNATDDVLALAATAGVGNKLTVLGALRRGDTAAAVSDLEQQLDSDLVILGLLPESAITPATARTLGRAATYRARHAHSSGDSTIDEAIKNVLSKRSAPPEDRK